MVRWAEPFVERFQNQNLEVVRVDAGNRYGKVFEVMFQKMASTMTQFPQVVSDIVRESSDVRNLCLENGVGDGAVPPKHV